MTPEFSRPIRLDTLGAEPRRLEIEAGEAERAALAERFGLVSIGRLTAEAALTRTGATVIAAGSLAAEVEQSCIATAEPVPETVAERFRIEFRPQPDPAAPDEEIELGERELDVVFYDGGAIDLGEAVAETLSLSLDPYPRSPAAEAALREAGVKSEDQARAESSPFASLAALKDKMGG
ncbi:MAG: hypothetical protein QOJ94_2156 [Sphingomonadales bacterium]|jgi:uncharacterized metal-binding protein YceD (DUF177 family)|nr:hypothetical protein [Sphingomonadales bacterium]